MASFSTILIIFNANTIRIKVYSIFWDREFRGRNIYNGLETCVKGVITNLYGNKQQHNGGINLQKFCNIKATGEKEGSDNLITKAIEDALQVLIKSSINPIKVKLITVDERNRCKIKDIMLKHVYRQ